MFCVARAAAPSTYSFEIIVGTYLESLAWRMISCATGFEAAVLHKGTGLAIAFCGTKGPIVFVPQTKYATGP